MFRFATRYLSLLGLLMLVVALGLWWRHKEPKPGAQVFFADTPEYKSKVASFKYSQEDARILGEKHLKAMQSAPYQHVGAHSAVVGDEYVFSSYEAKFGAALDGIYVNGHTGAVTLKKSIEVARP